MDRAAKIRELVNALDAIAAKHGGDCEMAHSDADEVILGFLDADEELKPIADAYQRVVDSCSWWATA